MIAINLQIFTGNNLSKDETDAELAKVKRELAELRAKEIIRSETKSTTPRSARKSKNMESSSSGHSTESTDHSVGVSFSISNSQLLKNGICCFNIKSKCFVY